MLIVKAGNLFPDVEEIVTDENDVPVDITGAVITFSMRRARDPADVVVQDSVSVVTDGPAGAMAHRWFSGETSLSVESPSETFQYLFKIVPTTGDPFYAPTAGWGVLAIEESF